MYLEVLEQLEAHQEDQITYLQMGHKQMDGTF
jgi:hypothetical protein